MPSFRVVVTDQVFPDVAVERGLVEAAGGELVVARDPQDAHRLVQDADGVLNTYLPIDRNLIGTMTRAKIIARYGIGVDNVDIEAARQAGIAVTNVPDYCVEEVATHAVALMLMLLRRIPQGAQIVRSGGWGVTGIGEVHRLSALTVGLLGAGRIGARVAAAVESLGGRIIVHDPYVQPSAAGRRLVSRDELFAESNLLSVHCPLTAQTRNLVDEAALRTLPEQSYLVNTSRGPIVNLADVVVALRSGRLAGAALDVLDREPPDPDTIASVPNLVVTPHVAFLSVEAVHESQHKATTQVLNALAGRALDYQL